MTAIVLYAIDPACHDALAGAGAFAAVRARLRGAVVETPLTRSNYRVLAPMPAALVAWGVTAWRLRVLADDDPPADAFARWTPRLAMALPHALHAATRAEGLGLPATLIGAPRCLLGPLGRLAAAPSPRAFAPVCASCSARAACDGLAAGYLDRFGAGELTPAAASPAPV